MGALGAQVLPGGPSAALSREPAAATHSHSAQLALQSGSPCRAVLTEPHTGRDGDEGHDAAEAAVEGEQHLVEVAGSRVGVELVEEGEGGGGKGVEGGSGQQHRHVPALVPRSTRQPVGARVRGGSTRRLPSTPALTSSCSKCARRP